MRIASLLTRIALAALLLAVALSTLLRGDGLALTLAVLALGSVVVPRERWPSGAWRSLGHPATRALLSAFALAAFFGLIRVGAPDSIYRSPEVRERFHRMYDEKMAEWPVPFRDRFVETEFGTVHLVVSGPPEAPPVLLLHASGVGGWSWKYNVGPLSRDYRTYAIDLLGDAGKSDLYDLSHPLETEADQARLYAEIADSLGVGRAYVVGASEGGFVATNYALAHPDRVAGLVLIGPMGYAGAVSAIARIMFTALFPIRGLQESTFAWAFSERPELQQDFGPWFRLLMTDVNPAKVAPLPFSPEERSRLRVPVLFVFGRDDRLVGDAEVARERVRDVRDAEVRIVEAGHLSAAEAPDAVNGLILEFLNRLEGAGGGRP